MIIYYLRKKAKYCNNNTYQFNTINCNFNASIYGIWEAYSDLDGGAWNASSEQTIRMYINDYRLQAALPWHTIDNILVLVNIKEKFHWVLIVVCFNNSTIDIYDSIKSAAHNVFIGNEVNKFERIIPTYLQHWNFTKRRAWTWRSTQNTNCTRSTIHSTLSMLQPATTDWRQLVSSYSILSLLIFFQFHVYIHGHLLFWILFCFRRGCGVYLLAFAKYLTDEMAFQKLS